MESDEILEVLEDYGVSNQTIISHFKQWLSEDTLVECLRDLAKELDIDLEDEEEDEEEDEDEEEEEEEIAEWLRDLDIEEEEEEEE